MFIFLSSWKKKKEKNHVLHRLMQLGNLSSSVTVHLTILYSLGIFILIGLSKKKNKFQNTLSTRLPVKEEHGKQGHSCHCNNKVLLNCSLNKGWSGQELSGNINIISSIHSI
ncbi:hypothetical protein L6164_001314 [Bauhinia variegata]|uniref:Uncharacterized protein n=1 Tax=Bauhinia variegata TaxID=167791 RepID=A0ACB9QBY7_BAUVA|nr:hypothetical protein L6164_001314 [Bauhinia variegata]